MAIRHLGGPGLRRAARSRTGFVALACALYAAAGLSATWPAVLHFRSDFLSGGAPGHGEASPGDHLQSLYHWWLVGHQLEHGHAPWLDPYSFRPEAGAQPNFPGWPFGFLYWPLGAAFGLVAAWNVMQLLLYVLAGIVACAWLRELGLPRGPALAGGLAFAIAPYRVEQSVGHMLGPISILLPLSLWAVERARRGSPLWLGLAGVALASIPLSGQVHLALGAIPFFVFYSAVRLSRPRMGGSRGVLYTGATLAVVAAVGAGVLVRQTVIVGSTQGGGRSLEEVRLYSARWGDFLARHVDHARSEQFVYLGWATPLLALLGLVLLIRSRRLGLAALLGLGALIPIVLAVGTRLPLYTALWHALPPVRFPRVPERLLPIACLCIGALVGHALARSRNVGLIVTLAVALLFLDLHARVYGKSAPGAPAAVRHVQGRMLELPIFDPGVHYGSVYLWYDTVARVQRPGGYSTTAPKIAQSTARRLERLNCGDWSGNASTMLRGLGIQTIVVHHGLFIRSSALPDSSFFAIRMLGMHGWRIDGSDGVVLSFSRSGSGSIPTGAEPPRDEPFFCQGWYGDTGGGRFMSEEHAPFWVYGSGTLRLRFAPSTLLRTFTVDERPQPGPSLRLGRRGWHVVTVDVPRLVQGAGGKRVGLRLLSFARSEARRAGG